MLCCCCKVLWRLVALLFYLLCHQYIMRCQDQFHRYLTECDWIHTGIHFSLRITYTQTHALLSRVPWTWPIINGFEKKTFRIRKDCVLENLCGRYRYIVYISFFAPMSKAINVSIIHLKQDTHVYINSWKRKTVLLAFDGEKRKKCPHMVKDGCCVVHIRFYFYSFKWIIDGCTNVCVWFLGLRHPCIGIWSYATALSENDMKWFTWWYN